jgi:hypothetical protein
MRGLSLPMNSSEYDSLFSSLNEAVEILARHRTSDPEFVIAMDTLKQARARIARSVASPADLSVQHDDLVAA